MQESRCRTTSAAPLSAEQFSYASAITDDNARADICAQGFWGNSSQMAFFDVRICNPTTQSFRNSSLEAVYRSQEREKRRQYEERINVAEMSSFTPLVFSIFGGMSKCTAVAYKRLADLLSVKRSETYSQVISCMDSHQYQLRPSQILNQCYQRIQIPARETGQA